MLWLTEDAHVVCKHEMGVVKNVPTQTLVTVAGRRVLVDSDPEGKSIGGCPNINPAVGMRPCLNTLKVQQGYSDFLRIDGRRICLDTVTGLTDGTPPGFVKYIVRRPGQEFVSEVK
jgi:hypothetical protein